MADMDNWMLDAYAGMTPGAPLSLAPPAAPSAMKEGDKLADMLRGVKMPAAPETQRLGLPSNAPPPRAPAPVKSGDLMQMMQILGMGNGAVAKNDYNLPSTLGAALRGR
jgi:hypothetical protein